MASTTQWWMTLGAEGQSLVLVTAAGVLGGLANAALERHALVLPRIEKGKVHLGFVGTLLVSLVAAHAVDHGFSTALIAAVCGGATLRRLKREIDGDFDGWQDRPGGEA